MCGIFGIIKKSNTDHKLSKFIDTLFTLTEPRGRHATGIAIKQKNKISVYKRPVNSSQLIRSEDYLSFLKNQLQQTPTTTAILGHCRLVTDGSELIEANNQPINSNDFTGVHNGVINNISQLKTDYSLQQQGSSDSEALFKLLDQISANHNCFFDAFKELTYLIKGAAALGIFSKNFEETIFSTNFGSLYYQEINSNLIVFSSEEKIIQEFCKTHSFMSKPIQLPSNSIATVDNNLQLNITQLQNCSQLKTKSSNLDIKNYSPNPSKVKRCKRCILPENYPFIKFDTNGVCNMCHKYKKQIYKGKDELNRFLDKYRSKNGEKDCLLGLSGGRDSSYALHLLIKEYGMNPIGFCYDWIMTSQKARHNISKMAQALDVEVIYRCGDYERHAKNIRDNINGFIKDPNLGMLTFVQAGDKEMYYHGRKIREEKGLDLTVWGSGFQLEQREFYIGYCGIDKTLVNNPRLYNYGWITKLQLALFYGMKTIKNPYLWNQSIIDNASAFWDCFVAKDDFLYLFEYHPWNEEEMETILREKYRWEEDKKHGKNQWRMDDFHTAFTNYVYYTVGGFSEFDDFRSNQIREGLLTRDKALILTAQDNTIRYESLLEFSRLIGFNLEHVLKKIEAIPKLYKY